MTEQQFSPLAARYMDTVFRVAYSYLRSPAAVSYTHLTLPTSDLV